LKRTVLVTPWMDPTPWTQRRYCYYRL